MPATGIRPEAPASMQDDPHLGTGNYDPATYWSARARRDAHGRFESVCVFGASEVENRCADRIQARSLLRAMRRVGIAGSRVLEYGCGIGRWASRVRGLGAEWVGVDLSDEMCERARIENPGCDAQVLQGGTRIPHPDAAFDVVYSVTVLHHNGHEAQEEILTEMLRVLRPGGTLLLMEAVGSAGSFNMFPRSHAGWIAFGRARGLEFVHSEGLHYWVLRGALASLRRPTGRAPSESTSPQSATTAPPPPRRGLVRRMVDHLDSWIDPWIQPLVPERARTGALFTFRKP